MASDDFNSNVSNCEFLTWEDLAKEPSPLSSSNDLLEVPLGVPPEPIENIEYLCPNFSDSPISLNSLGFVNTPHQKNNFEPEQQQRQITKAERMLFQNHRTEHKNHELLMKNKRMPWKNSQQWEYEDKFVKLSDIQNLAKPAVSVQKKEETCFPLPISSKKPRGKRVCGKAWLKCADDFENLKIVSKKSCSHCESEETPMWRNGPLGPKTLCNACGVRYSSGRLLPEYRPAASPTFDSSKHSNFHSRIIEKKDLS